jgi:hypothetical protein
MMPREQINYPDLTKKEHQKEARNRAALDGVACEVPEFGPWNDSSLHVSWLAADSDATVETDRMSNLGWVQIGFEVDVEYARMAQSSPNGSRPDRSIMYTDTLTPGELDRLIGVLKRARRKAFRVKETV